MAYQSLFRKYRPQTFADVMGQEHVTRTIQNAVAGGRVASGYLFTGTRGTAKTTVARLLAKVVNCLNVQYGATGLPEPCNACEACVSITGGSATDVIEMDAASHRGVADIEEVRRAVGYGPMSLAYKVFIIDEAHQLSSDAKDAFLKTLEEPPGNVVFILATTEPQAIPITIRSRCQQFDFKRGTLADIADRIRYVLKQENVAFEDAAVYLVARDAEGSWRDALSLLEQVLAYSPERLSTQSVEQALGVLDYESLARVTRAMRSGDITEAFAVVGALMDAGKEARTICRTLALHLRDLLLVSVGGGAAMDGMSADEIARRREDAQGIAPAVLLAAIEAVNAAQGELRYNNQHRLILELAFLKIIQLGRTTPLTAPALAQTPLPTAPMPARMPQTPVKNNPGETKLPVTPPVLTPAPAQTVSTEPPLRATELPVVTATPPLTAMEQFTEQPEHVSSPSEPLLTEAPEDSPDFVDSSPDDGVEPGGTLTLDLIQSVWPTYLQTLEGRSKMAAMTLQGVTPYAVQGNVVTFLFANPQRHSQVTESRPRQEFLVKALRDTLRETSLAESGADVAIRYVLNDGKTSLVAPARASNPTPTSANTIPTPVRATPISAPPNPAHTQGNASAAPTPAVPRTALATPQPAGEDFEMAMETTPEPPPNPESDPLVQDVIRIFGGRVVPK